MREDGFTDGKSINKLPPILILLLILLVGREGTGREGQRAHVFGVVILLWDSRRLARSEKGVRSRDCIHVMAATGSGDRWFM